MAGQRAWIQRPIGLPIDELIDQLGHQTDLNAGPLPDQGDGPFVQGPEYRQHLSAQGQARKEHDDRRGQDREG